MSKQDQWTSKLGFILAAAGSAIGLGAIWKLPYMTGENGGGVFFLLFIIFTLLIGAPILIAEFTIGRNAQKDAISAYKHIAPGKPWALIGYGGVVASIILLSFFSVVGGWIISYLARSFTGSLSNLTQEEYGNFFNTIISNPYETVIAQLLFMVFTIWVVQGGVSKGIEKANKYMMPSLFILFIILLIRSLTLDGAMEGVKFFLKPDFSALTGETILLALGQSFFALSVGVSVMVTYASYLSKKEDITKSAFSVVGLNIFISLLAGLVIFPAVFALGFSPSSGPGLVFVVLPAVFNEMALGGIFMFIFFILLLFATLTTAFSILEIVVAAMIKGDSAKRKKASWIAGITVFLIGIPSALSFGVLSDVKIFNLSIFDFADYLTSNIALPVGALFISLFIGYQMKRIEVQKEFETGADPGRSLFKLWHFLIRYIVPIMIILVFLKSTNLI
ncbi:sodium-dependent transporter [Peribacillus castrilensis]|jgi:NSS family neurotransmitter:Na+ symporter|uniref:Sodium-dependent transporter n=1 Tax=Peribacillus simplex TaxID=1478 RepID=A0AAN2PDJ0_9BACI|nr:MULTISPECIES: sodium-dependent transporter [Peribacillus]MCP1095560.1 sodium-dependent transporter [Bacillaceae bacterium OS4b]QYF83584.1 sodium-dependent transporter [Brevibacterium sp. PAMC21349]MBD8586589.1 sodium-dependent transporter [Peribacillus simplex]MCT1388067.1 sodium-dependent transporter [Peribacillus frigoritolerans]USK64709.1 sodium-dependent transporter [Peribacillus frigoritolerans]